MKTLTVDEEDDINAINKCIWCCNKANSFTSKLLNQLSLNIVFLFQSFLV